MKINFDKIKLGLNWQGSLAKTYIEHSGSKAGTYQYLQDTNPALRKHLPSDTHYLAPNEDVERFLDKVDFSNQKIVRGCHPLDFFGMVDVIPTKVGVYGREEVRKSVDEVLKKAKSKEVRNFVNYEFDLTKQGLSFDGEIGILVQDQFNYIYDLWEYAPVIGSIVEHPHEKGIYRISIGQDKFLNEAVSNKEGRCLGIMDRYSRDFKSSHIDPQLAKDTILLYKQIQDSGLVPDGYSFQMEFGYGKDEDDNRKINLFQARLFKPHEPKADFEPDCRFMSLPYGAFGITPESGIEIKLAPLDPGSIDLVKSASSVAYNICRGVFSHEASPLDVKPKNLGAYLIGSSFRRISSTPTVLQHGDFRWVQKAPVSLLFDFDFKEIETKTIKVYSNGIVGGIEPAPDATSERPSLLGFLKGLVS